MNELPTSLKIHHYYGQLLIMRKFKDINLLYFKLEFLKYLNDFLIEKDVFCEDIQIDFKKHEIYFINPSKKRKELHDIFYNEFPASINYIIRRCK